jgi:hypothetical protein
MSGIVWRTASLAVTIAATSLTARAQAVRALSVGLALGSSIPTGALSDRVHSGYAIDGNAIYRFGTTPLGLRADITYTGYGLTNSYLGQFQGADNGHAGVTSGTLDLTINMPRVLRLQPYLVGGGGMYRRHIAVDRTTGAQFVTVFDPYFGFYDDVFTDQATVHASTQTKFGMNGGVGVLIPATYINVFFEAKYNSAFTQSRGTRFVPITVGVEW